MSEPLLAGRLVLLTGGGTGIGRAIAHALGAHGARVGVTDLDAALAAEVAAELGPGHAFARLDVTDEAETAAAFTAIGDALGGLDTVVANAGVSTMNALVDLTVEEWDFNMAVNAKGVFLTNREALRRWRADGTKGVICNTASLAAKAGAPLLAHYSASKFAAMGLTQAAAREAAPFGIRVNCVCPGFVATGMQRREVTWEATLRGMSEAAVTREYIDATPLGRLQAPEDVAGAVAFLCSDLARFITGEALNVTGGVRMD